MPDPTFDYINSVAVADGGVLDANQLADMLGARTHSPEGPVGYNGQVDQANLAFTEVTRDMVRKGTWTGEPRTVGSTVNTDYFEQPLFKGINLNRVTEANNTRGSTYPKRLVSVGGLSQTVYVKESAKAFLVAWGVTFATVGRAFANDDFRPRDSVPNIEYAAGWDDAGNPITSHHQLFATRMALYINGVRMELTDLRFKEGLTTMTRDIPVGDGVGTYNELGHLELVNPARPDLRAYSGCLVVDTQTLAANGDFDFGTTPMFRGWHDFSLCVGTNQPAVRTQVKRLTVIPLYG